MDDSPLRWVALVPIVPWSIRPLDDSPQQFWTIAPLQRIWVLYIEQKLNNNQKSGWENQMSSVQTIVVGNWAVQTIVVGNWAVICQLG